MSFNVARWRLPYIKGINSKGYKNKKRLQSYFSGRDEEDGEVDEDDEDKDDNKNRKKVLRKLFPFDSESYDIF